MARTLISRPVGAPVRVLVRPMPFVALIFAIVLCAQPASAETPQVVFPGGEVMMSLPGGYGSRFDDGGETLVVFPRSKSFELRITFHSLAKFARQRSTLPKDFIADAAQKNGRPLFQLKSNDSVGYAEATKASSDDAPPSFHTHGAISLGRGYATFTLSFERKDFEQPDVMWVRQDGLLELLGRLQYVGA